MELTVNIPVIKYESSNAIELDDMVVKEYALTIFLDGEEFVTLLCTPSSLDLLTIGFLLSESIIKSKDDIIKLRVDEGKGIADVLTSEAGSIAKRLHGKRTMTTGCGKGSSFYNVMDSISCRKVAAELQLDAEYILELMKDFNKRSELFLNTGGVHSVALGDAAGIILFHEDVGRHNAMDKVIGEASIMGIGLSDKIVLTSGRVSSEILIKAAKAGIPVIVSRSSPTDLAVELSVRLGVTVIGFARGHRMNIYSNPERIRR